MSEDNLLTADDLLTASRKRVTLSSGKQVIICKVGMLEMAEISNSLPDVTSIADAKRVAGDLAKTDPVRMAQIIEAVVHRGVVSPELGKKRSEGKPVAADFPQVDLMLLFNEIHDLSGFTKEVADATAPLSETSA